MRNIVCALTLTFALLTPAHVYNAQIVEIGPTELIGINEQVNTSEYSASVSVSVTRTAGDIVRVCLYATQDDSGAIITENGTLLMLNADPSTSAGDTTITAAEHITNIATFSLGGSDYQSDANGAKNCQFTNEIFPATTSLIFVYFHEGATQWNSGATDDEQLELIFWYRRE